jgi:hypothetical protein
MLYNITVIDDGTTKIEVDFSDEDVNLQGVTHVKGGESEALQYLPVFENDLRHNNIDLFPRPEMPEILEGMEGGMF